MKIQKPRALTNKVGPRGGCTTTVKDILPYLPNQDCFFDCRHFVYETTNNFLPFALTTRVSCNNQQYLKIYEKDNSNQY